MQLLELAPGVGQEDEIKDRRTANVCTLRQRAAWSIVLAHN